MNDKKNNCAPLEAGLVINLSPLLSSERIAYPETSKSFPKCSGLHGGVPKNQEHSIWVSHLRGSSLQGPNAGGESERAT
jgi:hypothetical protein